MKMNNDQKEVIKLIPWMVQKGGAVGLDFCMSLASGPKDFYDFLKSCPETHKKFAAEIQEKVASIVAKDPNTGIPYEFQHHYMVFGFTDGEAQGGLDDQLFVGYTENEMVENLEKMRKYRTVQILCPHSGDFQTFIKKLDTGVYRSYDPDNCFVHATATFKDAVVFLGSILTPDKISDSLNK